jgi:hypothetical protein
MRAMRQPSMRPCRRASASVPSPTPSSTPPSSVRPGPISRKSASGSASPAVNAAARAM